MLTDSADFQAFSHDRSATTTGLVSILPTFVILSRGVPFADESRITNRGILMNVDAGGERLSPPKSLQTNHMNRSFQRTSRKSGLNLVRPKLPPVGPQLRGEKTSTGPRASPAMMTLSHARFGFSPCFTFAGACDNVSVVACVHRYGVFQ